MKNRTTVHHGLLSDLKSYREKSGWTIQETKGKYEVLRATKYGYPRPLIVFDRERGCGYSIDERDLAIYKGWHKNRRKRGLDPLYPSTDEEKREAGLISG